MLKNQLFFGFLFTFKTIVFGQNIEVYAEHAFDLVYMEFQADSTLELVLELETIRNITLDSISIRLKPNQKIRYAYNLSTPYYQRLIESGDYVQVGNTLTYKISVNGKQLVNQFVPRDIRIKPPAKGIIRTVDIVRPNYIQQPCMDEIRKRLF